MPTVIGHSLVAVTAAFGFRTEAHPWKFVLLSVACAAAPDADIAGYLWLYVPYDSFLGHRGFFHSPFFAALLSLVVVGTFFRGPAPALAKRGLFVYFFLLTASHGVLDAMTNGGRGIALLSPFSNRRFFLPWRPLEVSPIGLEAFLSQRGIEVLINEFVWIGLPCLLAAAFLVTMKKSAGKPSRVRSPGGGGARRDPRRPAG